MPCVHCGLFLHSRLLQVLQRQQAQPLPQGRTARAIERGHAVHDHAEPVMDDDTTDAAWAQLENEQELLRGDPAFTDWLESIERQEINDDRETYWAESLASGVPTEPDQQAPEAYQQG